MEIKFLFPYGNEILISVPLKGYKLECFQNKIYKLGARTLGARSGGSKNVTYREQTRKQTSKQTHKQTEISNTEATLIPCGSSGGAGQHPTFKLGK